MPIDRVSAFPESSVPQAGVPQKEVLDDPLLAYEHFPHCDIFYPLGIAVEIETNHPAVLAAAALSWPEPEIIEPARGHVPALKLRLGVAAVDSVLCPPMPQARAQQHLISFVADSANSVVCDLQAGFGFGWITTAALHHVSYLRYCVLELTVLTLLCGRDVTPLHAACISLGGRGLLLSGRSGAGKSTLAYACARDGFTYTSDDSSYLLRHSDELRVRGSAHLFRFRPSARELFPELNGLSLTPRVEGKPSIEVPTAELPGIVSAADAPVHAFILLDRRDSPTTELTPLTLEEALPHLEESLFPLPQIRALQRPALQRMLRAQFYTLHYRDLTPAIRCLRRLALGESA